MDWIPVRWLASQRAEQAGTSRGASPGERTFRDDAGAIWRVREREMSRTADGVQRVALVFESDCALRLVYSYPRDWRELTDAELERLSWRR
jgi:hypothetical protein